MFNRSLRIGRIADTDVRLHWSLLLGCAYLYWLVSGSGAISVVVGITLTLSVFISIVLHEFGHTLVAQRLGYPTRQIVLWMLGGLAILERVPRRSRDKILIYAAGPLVNLAIAGLVVGTGWALTALVVGDWDLTVARWLTAVGLPPLSVAQLGSRIVWINLALALFNLLPIYPLDGGRILHAALTPVLGERRADLVTLIIGGLLAAGQLVFFSIQGEWAVVGETLFLLLLVCTLNPWFSLQLAQGFMWGFHRGGYYALHRQDYDRALAYADQQIAHGRRVPEHHLLRSYILLKADDLPAAGAQRAMALNNRGTIAWLQGDDAAARVDIDQAILADPTVVYGYTSRGEIAAYRGEADLALADLTAAIEIAPALSGARYHRAALRFQLGDLEGSRSDAAHMFADDHNEMINWSEEEQRRWLTNQLPWAHQIAAWADTHAWSSARVQGFLGDTLWVNGRATEAVAAYTQALVATPIDTALLLRRAQAHQACGAIAASQTDIQSVLAARPTAYIRQRAMALLAILTPTAIVPNSSTNTSLFSTQRIEAEVRED